MRSDWDDEHLLAALREAVAARQAVPAKFIETGKNAFAWHNVDAELAQLTYDSSRDEGALAKVRAETASVRALTFSSARFMIELEVTTTGLLGQVMPPGEGTIEAESQSGDTTVAAIDEAGGFSLEPLPASPFRLRCRTAAGGDVVTGWITL
ncbi:MAG: hypothetical protein LBV34_04770 [Nocardiopsaceae bacterium]|nr:hypothetical protein [Nocardiopsaceae bacterium]